jgi:hypothetical protein
MSCELELNIRELAANPVGSPYETAEISEFEKRLPYSITGREHELRGTTMPTAPIYRRISNNLTSARRHILKQNLQKRFCPVNRTGPWFRDTIADSNSNSS